MMVNSNKATWKRVAFFVGNNLDYIDLRKKLPIDSIEQTTNNTKLIKVNSNIFFLNKSRIPINRNTT